MERINSKDAHGRDLHGVKDGKRVFRKPHYRDGGDSLPRTPITVEHLITKPLLRQMTYNP